MSSSSNNNIKVSIFLVLIVAGLIILFLMFGQSIVHHTPVIQPLRATGDYEMVENSNNNTSVINRHASLRKRRIIGNNCLFDAAVTATPILTSYGKPENSQFVRDKCNEILKEEGMPIFEDGETAGEQYLQALSKLTKRKIRVFNYNTRTKIADIKHGDIPSDDENIIEIAHMGTAENGHWVSSKNGIKENAVILQ